MVLDKKTEAQKIGEAGELRFQLDATLNGLVVYKPVQPYAHIDFIVGKGGRLFRVQVKARKVGYNNGTPTYNFQKGGLNACYNKQEFDVLAAFCVDRNAWAMLHASALHGRRNAWLPAERKFDRAGALPWTDWTIFMRAGSHQPAHQPTRPILQLSPEL